MHAEDDVFESMNRIVSAVSATSDEDARDLLHERLRTCLIVLALAMLLLVIFQALSPARRAVHLGFEGVVEAAILLAVTLLSTRWRPSLLHLRAIELFIFGWIGLFISADVYWAMRVGVLDPDVVAWRVAGFLKIGLAYATALIFTYAIFIPNDWRRAMWVIGAIAASPLLAVAVLFVRLPAFRVLVDKEPSLEFGNLGEHLLVLGAAAATAVFGVRTIQDFRREAVRQREMTQYRLGKKLGDGGMGEVYLAEHRLLKRPCALKLISAKNTVSRNSRARFELEVRATARLSHWNSVEIYDYGRTEGGEFYYVMEYLPGLSLQQLVDRHGPMPASRAIFLLRQVCEALREAHLAGLIHRDLKPPNVMAAFRGARYDVAKVLDFGLVKTVGEGPSPMLTLEGFVTGSPLYMAPELVQKRHAPDARADLYSLGAVAYFLMTGRPPFLGADAIAVMMAHASDPVEPMSEHNPAVPPDLERVVLRCLEKDPADRYPSASDLSRDLAACADAGAWNADRAEAWWREHEPLAVADGDVEEVAIREDLASLDAADFEGVDQPSPPPAVPSDPLLTIGDDPAYPGRPEG